ncbi:MAG TPA: antibiotic biosynthesis monooxygenase [Acidobacteria bacterium]|nr:antibiotic biosynthesis monooxygenase [Acidobacteriota bacterium]
MHEGKVHVVALFVAAPGKENELAELLESLVEPTRREAGCIRYDLLRGLPGEAGDFAFVEEWENEATLDAHSRSAHLQAVIPKVVPLLGAPANVARYRQIR